MLLSKCAVFNRGMPKCFKEKEAIELLGRLGVKTHLNKIPLVGPLLC